MNMIKMLVAASTFALAVSANATAFTSSSPTGGVYPAGVTQVGGIVLDLKGANGVRVVSQLAASSLFVGFSAGNPQVIGTQTGFNAATVAALGGGIVSASVRVTLFDGDSAPGDFDAGSDNTFFVDGVNFGDWGFVATEETDTTGASQLSLGTGFGNNILSTGFFSSLNAADLATLYGSLADGSIVYSLTDVDPTDNFYDFTQGVDGGLINTGTPPVVVPGVPEPTTWAMLLAGFGFIGATLRRRARAMLAA